MMAIPLQSLWDKLRFLKGAIKDWYQRSNVGDPFRISQLEKEIERIDKGMLDCQSVDTMREVLTKKKTFLWSLYRAEERS